MCKRILSMLLSIMMILSCAVISFAEDERIPEAGDHIFFGHYEQDNDLNNGPEPIEWRVLDVRNDKMLLLSEYVLDAVPFNKDGRTMWNNCYLREWMNNDFLNQSFSENEAICICLTEVDNGPKQNYNFRNGCENTKDYLFSLSCTELIDYLGFSQAACKATDYANPKIIIQCYANLPDHVIGSTLYNNGTITYEKGQNVPWWLRSPSASWHDMMCVPSEPKEGRYDNMYFECDCESPSGVRPAVWVDINQYLELLLTAESEEEVSSAELTIITCDVSITADTVLGDTAWKLWLPDGFTADELTEADLAENYIGYYLRDDDIIAVQYYDNTYSLAEWQNELVNRGFTVKGLYQINGAEAVLYQNEEEDFLTASVLDGKGKLLEVSFFPYSKMAEEADTVISSIQQETSRRKLSGAGGNTKTTADSATTTESAGKTFASQEEAYKAMVDAYKAGNYSDSYSYYEQAKGYQDADKYGNLLKARLCYDLKLKYSEIESLEKAIVSDIDFVDSKNVLVCNSAIAHYYLLGYWRTSNGMHGYEVSPDWYSNTTVPAIPKSGDYYTILGGTYWSYFDGKWDDRVAQYKFTPISKSKMEMYSYQAKQSYTFNKVR